MKSDLDHLMQARGLDAIFITGPAQHNPSMTYMTGGAHLTHAELIKKRGEEPVLFYNPMERDEAAKSGLKTKNLSDYQFPELLKQTGGDHAAAMVLRYQLMLQELSLTRGRVGIFGKIDSGTAYTLFSSLQQAMPELVLVGEMDDSVLMQARATKDEEEVSRIRRMGQITTEVVGLTAEFLTSHAVSDSRLVKADGQPLTIGEVKRQINLWLAERDAENPAGTIFAIGRDAGVPHSSGNPSDPLVLGKTIVFDIFPCEAGGGYHYDFTRTWCLGYAPDEVQKLYEDVLSVFQQIMSELEAGAEWPSYQKRTCDLFEAMGHPTIQSNPTTQEGYVHGLGHGLGLNVHERPSYRKVAAQADLLAPGVITTVEPGLYYPERGMGVRLEDTVWVRPDGQIEILAPYPLDLVLKIK
jgi:Xaa-Pro aminopeptidase